MQFNSIMLSSKISLLFIKFKIYLFLLYFYIFCSETYFCNWYIFPIAKSISREIRKFRIRNRKSFSFSYLVKLYYSLIEIFQKHHSRTGLQRKQHLFFTYNFHCVYSGKYRKGVSRCIYNQKKKKIKSNSLQGNKAKFIEKWKEFLSPRFFSFQQLLYIFLFRALKTPSDLT